MFFFCLVFTMPLCVLVYMYLVVTCWERADILALVCGAYFSCHFPSQMWFLIVSIPDLCTVTYFQKPQIITIMVIELVIYYIRY